MQISSESPDPHRTIKCRNYANYNLVNLVNDAQNINWSRILENNSDVNAAVNYLTAQLKTLFDSHAPIVEKRVKGKPCECRLMTLLRRK